MRTTDGGATVDVSALVWGLTIAGIVGLLLFDFVFHVRQAHTPTLREAAIWSSIYVGLAVVFGIGLWIFGGPRWAPEYFAGYVTEKALSVDNLFVFLVIMASFKVPRADQQKVLLFGIVFALIARSAFIFAGVALINLFSWVFYVFGAILLWTAVGLLRGGRRGDEADNFLIRFARKHLRTSEHYDGDKLFTIENGKRVLTPMLLVMIAIGGTGPAVRARLDPRDLRPDREPLHRVHRHRVLADGPAAAVLPHRRPARPARLPLLRPRHDPRLHRREARAARPARELAAVRQRRAAGAGVRDQHRGLAGRHHRRPRDHRDRLAGQPGGRAKTVETTIRKHARAAVDDELPESDRAVAYRSLVAAQERMGALPRRGAPPSRRTRS
jgi:hypothetical protein